MYRIVFLLLVTVGLKIQIFSQNFDYVKAFGGIGTERVYDMATDADGNVIMTGLFNNTVDFDPGPGLMELTSQGGDDIYVLKLNSDGELLWVKQIGASLDEIATSLSIDPMNNIVIGGQFYGTVDFDPGDGINELSSISTDAFICKLDSDGEFVYAHNLSESNSSDETFSVATDAMGNVYAVGRFTWFLGQTGISSNGQNDIFIVKLNASGNLLWAQGFGDSWDDYAYNVVVDDAGSTIFLTGFFRRTVDFDPSENIVELTSYSNSPDAYILQLDSNGNYLWVGQFGGDYVDRGYSVLLDGNENVFLNGIFAGTGDFDPGIDTFNLVSGGNNTNYYDHFLLRLNADKSLNWADNLNMNSYGLYNAPYFNSSISVSPDGKLLETGFFQSSADFDPTSTQYLLTSYGSRDVFMRKLDVEGNLDWAVNFGSTSGDIGHSVSFSSDGGMLLSGTFRGTVDFDPGTGVSEITSNGNSEDYFLLKLSENMVGHTINIPSGWSGISSYLIPDQTALEDVFDPIANELIIAQTLTGIYFPGQNLNTIGNWESQSAYMVKTSGATTLTINGEPETNMSVSLNAGWNLLPVVSSVDVNAADLFLPLSNLVIAKDLASTGVYWPNYGINTLGVLETGKAYFAYLTSPETVDFTSFKSKQTNIHNPVAGQEYLAIMDIQPTSSTHIIALQPDAAKIFEAGSIIGAYDENGSCFGITAIEDGANYITLFGDDPTTEEKDGFFLGEAFRLMQLSGNESRKLEAIFDMSLPHASGMFADNGISAISEFKNTSSNFDQTSSIALNIYPNPTSGKITISGLSDKSEITVFDLHGQKLSAIITEPGQTGMDLSDLPKGIYFVRVKTPHRMFKEKIVVE